MRRIEVGRRARRIGAAVCVLVGVSACGAHREPMVRDAGPGFTIVRPTIVAFAPSVSDDVVARNPELAAALEHWSAGLENAAACLHATGIPVQTVRAAAFTLTIGRTFTVTVRPSADAGGIGAYLVAPYGETRLLLLANPSAFVHQLSGAAAEVFDVARCCTDTARELRFCSPDKLSPPPTHAPPSP